jgi:hypothetical protein
MILDHPYINIEIKNLPCNEQMVQSFHKFFVMAHNAASQLWCEYQMYVNVMCRE